MRVILRFCLLISILLSSTTAMAARTVLEAEGMTLDGEGWTATDHYEGWYSGYPSDSTMLHGANNLAGTARGIMPVAKTGDYVLWVRYLNAPGSITVQARQGVKTVADVALDAAPGAQASAFIFKKIPLRLEAGEVQIVLGMGTVATKDRMGRNVDCFILTDEQDYTPKIEDLVKPVYIKVRIGKEQKLACAIHVFGVRPFGWQNRWYISHCNIYRTGIIVDEANPTQDCNDPKSGALHPGEESPWISLVPLLTPHGRNAIELSAMQSYPVLLPEAYFTVFLSHTSDEKGIFKTFTRAGKGGGMLLNLDLMNPKAAQTDVGYSAWNREEAERLQPVEGKRPTRFPVFTGCGLTSKFYQPSSLDNERFVMEALGMGGADNDDPYWFEHGFPWFQGGAPYFGEITFHDDGTYCTYKLDVQGVYDIIDRVVASELKRPADRPKPLFWNQMDEMATVTLEHMKTCADCAKGVREYLKGRGFTPTDFGATAWEDIKPVADSKGDPKLYYWSMKFRNQIGPDYFKLGTERIRQKIPDVRLGCNFNEDLTYQGNALFSGVDWFGIYEQDALNYGWTEDWINGSFTTQFAGYRGDFLRSACRFGALPHGIYVVLKMPWDTAAKTLSQIGHGASAIEYYTYGPDYAGSVDGCSSRTELWPFLRRTNYLIGEVEEYLIDAKRPRSRVGLLYLETSDIWTLDNPQVFSNAGKERMGQYLLLTHLGYPLDVLTENNLIAGEAKNYDILFVTGSYMRREALAPLVQWVKGGGQLYMAPGTLLYDEYHTALGADAQLGIARGAFDKFENVGQDNTMFNLTVKGKATAANIGEVDVICSRQALAPMPGGVALATFAGGAPALVSVPLGRGRVVVSGVNLGLAYMKSGSAVRKDELQALYRTNGPFTFTAPSHYDAAPRLLFDRIMAGVPFRPAARGDQYLVETNLLVGPKGRVVTLSNYG